MTTRESQPSPKTCKPAGISYSVLPFVYSFFFQRIAMKYFPGPAALTAGLLLCMLLPIASAQTAPTFVGIRTFLGAPYEPDLDKLRAEDGAHLRFAE